MLKLKETGSWVWLLAGGIVDVTRRVQSGRGDLKEGSGEPVVA